MNKLFMAAAASSLALSIGCAPPAPRPVLWYTDFDRDGYGDENDANPVLSVTAPSGASYSKNNTDCDDADANSYPGNPVEDDNDGQDNNCNGVVDEKTYAIGDIGPAGGLVFYVSDDGLNGLEAATEDIAVDGDFTHRWGCYDPGNAISGPEDKIGYGPSSTQEILAKCSEPGSAARLADDYVQAGFDDWFLPSIDELLTLRLAAGLANDASMGFSLSDLYWSSRDFGFDLSWYYAQYPAEYLWFVKAVCMGVDCGVYPAPKVAPKNVAYLEKIDVNVGRVRAVRTLLPFRLWSDYLSLWHLDLDGDGYGDSADAYPVMALTDPSGDYNAYDYSADNTDCDDADSNSFPNNPELADSRDNNCNGTIDEGWIWYLDLDSDGYGDMNETNPVISDTDPSGVYDYSLNNTDCDDTNPNNSPGIREFDDGQDNNCNDVTDEDTYAIGEMGPAGGTVFEISEDGTSGLEIASEDAVDANGGQEFVWQCWKKTSENRLVAPFDWVVAECLGLTASQAAEEYEQGGFDDWYLPLLDSLRAIRLLNYNGLGVEFHLSSYWSSTARYQDGGYYLNDCPGGWATNYLKKGPCADALSFYGPNYVDHVNFPDTGSSHGLLIVPQRSKLRVRAVRSFSTL